MMEWTSDILNNLLDSLIDYRGKTPKKTSFGIPLITAKIVKGGRILEPDEFIAESDYDSWMVRGLPQTGDVILTVEAPLGEVAQLDDRKIALAQRTVCLRGKQGVLDNTYLKYFLLSPLGQFNLRARETGTTVTGIKQSELRKVEITYPPFEIQQKIAAILSSLDAQIENNNRINRNLEEQAQVLFNSLVEGTKTALAPMSKVCAKICDGVHNTVKDDPCGEYLLLSCKNIVGGQLKIGDSERRINKESFDILRKRTQLAKGDVLISTVGTVGEILLLSVNPENIEFQRSVGILKPNKEILSPEYLYCALKSKKRELVATAHGAVQQCIFLGDLREFQIELAATEIVNKFTTLSAPIFEHIQTNQIQSSRLASLRDTLLPKLMKGEIEI